MSSPMKCACGGEPMESPMPNADWSMIRCRNANCVLGGDWIDPDEWNALMSAIEAAKAEACAPLLEALESFAGGPCAGGRCGTHYYCPRCAARNFLANYRKTTTKDTTDETA